MAKWKGLQLCTETAPLFARAICFDNDRKPASVAHFICLAPQLRENNGVQRANKSAAKDLEKLIEEMASATETPRKLTASTGPPFVKLVVRVAECLQGETHVCIFRQAQLLTDNAKTVVVGSVVDSGEHYQANLRLLKRTFPSF